MPHALFVERPTGVRGAKAFARGSTVHRAGPVQAADDGDVETSIETLITAAEQIEVLRPKSDGVEEGVGDKEYHSNQSLVAFEAVGVRSYISEPDSGDATGKEAGGPCAVYRRRVVRKCVR